MTIAHHGRGVSVNKYDCARSDLSPVRVHIDSTGRAKHVGGVTVEDNKSCIGRDGSIVGITVCFGARAGEVKACGRAGHQIFHKGISAHTGVTRNKVRGEREERNVSPVGAHRWAQAVVVGAIGGALNACRACAHDNGRPSRKILSEHIDLGVCVTRYEVARR